MHLHVCMHVRMNECIYTSVAACVVIKLYNPNRHNHNNTLTDIRGPTRTHTYCDICKTLGQLELFPFADVRHVSLTGGVSNPATANSGIMNRLRVKLNSTSPPMLYNGVFTTLGIVHCLVKGRRVGKKRLPSPTFRPKEQKDFA